MSEHWIRITVDGGKYDGCYGDTDWWPTPPRKGERIRFSEPLVAKKATSQGETRQTVSGEFIVTEVTWDKGLGAYATIIVRITPVDLNSGSPFR